MNKPIKIDISELYENRVIVMFESEPLSNMYSQVLLTEEQFKLVGEAIIVEPYDVLKEDTVYTVNVRIDESREIELPDMQSVYKENTF